MDDQPFDGREIDIGVTDNIVIPVVVPEVVVDIGQRIFHFLSYIRRNAIILTGRSAGGSGYLGSGLGNKKGLCHGVGNDRRCYRIEIERRAYYAAKLAVDVTDTTAL